MDAASVTRIEKGVDRSASALFGLACGYAAYAWFAGRTQEPLLGLEATAACALGYLLSLKGLSSIQPQPRKLPVPIFDVREVEPMPPVERPVLQRVRPAAERPEATPSPEPPVVEAESISESPAVGEAESPAVGEAESPVARESEAPAETAGQPEPEAPPAQVDGTELELNDPAQADLEKPETVFVPEADRDEAAQDSRVVHLFDPAAMPTPEEMISRIDRHFEGQATAAQSADAAQALHQALAELRRSIR